MSVKLEFGFNVPKNVIYEALTDTMRVMQYTRAKAEVQNQEGGSFSMLDGKIQGKFLTLRKGDYIKMDWKFNDWDKFSKVEVILEEDDEDECTLTIIQTEFPAADKEKLTSGWKHHILEPMSKILGYPFRD